MRDTPGPYSGPKKIPGEPLKPWEPNALLSPGTFTESKRESFLLTTKASPRAFSSWPWASDSQLPGCKRTNLYLVTGCSFFPFITLHFFFATSKLHWLLAKNLRNLYEKVEYLITGKVKSLIYLIISLRSGFCVFAILSKCTIQCRAGQLLNTWLWMCLRVRTMMNMAIEKRVIN